jgi:phosphotriesterase-related protein
MIQTMKDNKLLHKILLSHDAGWYDVGGLLGNKFKPYAPVFTALIPALKEAGFTQEEINQLIVKNPKKAYAISVNKH